MKTLAKMLMLAVMINTFSLFTSEKATAQNVSVSFQLFYDELSPYGSWVDYPGHGYAWIPSVSGFYPYSTGGHWVYTYYGWTWVSDYSWGWAPFHYGRWDYDPYYGWVWLPGQEWGPAWVVWAHNPGYYGWAPMRPGMSINVHYNTTHVHHNHWVFVNEQYMGTANITQHYAPRSSNSGYLKKSTVISNKYYDKDRKTTYVSGPSRDQVQKATGKSVRTLAVKEDSKPGVRVKGDEVNMYRPQVKTSTESNKKPAPARVSSKEEIKKSGGPAAKGTRSEGVNKGAEKSAPSKKYEAKPMTRDQQQQKEVGKPKQESPYREQQQEKQPARKNEGQQKEYGQPKQEAPSNKKEQSQPSQRNDGPQQKESNPSSQYKKDEPSQQPAQRQEKNYQQRRQMDKSQPNRNTGRPKKPNE
jgi:hypothetical protein